MTNNIHKQTDLGALLSAVKSKAFEPARILTTEPIFFFCNISALYVYLYIYIIYVCI